MNLVVERYRVRMPTHNLTVSHEPFDGPGIRASRPGDDHIHDVTLGDLRELRESVETALEQTRPFLSEETRPLAEAVRAALIGIDTLALHIANLHRAIEEGNINYPETVSEALGQ